MKTLSYWSALKKQVVLPCVTMLTVMFSLTVVIADASDPEESLLTQYVQSKGSGIIVFESSNIKQFWIDSSVVSKDNSINILLSSKNAKWNESVPLKIQLANVNEAQDCKIEVISETNDISFIVLNKKKQKVSSSKKENDFLNYSIESALFHMEDTQNTSFYLEFNSRETNNLSIKKIVLSFSNNADSSYIAPPGEIRFMNNIRLDTTSILSDETDNAFRVTGKRSQIFSTKKILVSDNTLTNTVKIKNTGENSTVVYVGYATYTKDQIRLDGRNYPYKKDSKNLSIVSIEADNKIIVNSYSDWAKNCFLAINTKEDLSDVPNNVFAGRIAEIKELKNGQAEITLEENVKTKFEKGTNVRVHGASGAYLYMNIQVLDPGEEVVFSSKIKKDDSFREYSNQALSRGVYCVIPVILSYSIDPKKDNTIQISDYVISY